MMHEDGADEKLSSFALPFLRVLPELEYGFWQKISSFNLVNFSPFEPEMREDL